MPAIDTLGVGTRMALPVSSPASAGSAFATALAAPVDVSTMLRVALRPRATANAPKRKRKEALNPRAQGLFSQRPSPRRAQRAAHSAMPRVLPCAFTMSTTSASKASFGCSLRLSSM